MPGLATTLLLAGLLAVGRGLAVQAAGDAGMAAVFTDEAAAWGIDFVHFNGMSGELYLPEITGAGAAFLDYDGDGDLDVYLVQGAMLGPGETVGGATLAPRHPLPLSDRLYRNDAGAGPRGEPRRRFVDVTGRAGLQGVATGYGMGVTTGDYDGDGSIDLYLTNFGPNQLLHNLGDGTFADRTTASGTDDPAWSAAATFFDYDADGRVDLFVANYVDFDYGQHMVCRARSGAPDYCGPLTYEPLGDRLFRNRGDGTFEDVTAAAGIHATRGSGLGTVAADFDGDGRQDLYVANDGLPNFLWRNQGDGTFSEDALLAGCAVDREGKAEASMGVLAQDIDGDGDEDLFMTHLVQQTNTFFLNLGGGVFSDHTVQTGLGPPSIPFTAFGTVFLDYDNDGELDLMVANGAVTKLEELVNQGDPYPLDQPNQLFRNAGGLRFEDVTAEAGPVFRLVEVSRGLAVGDVDQDGDADALLANNNGPARLLVNRLGQDRHWLGLRLVAGGTDALGALVASWVAGEPARRRRVHTDGSFASANDPRVLVGLGEARGVERVEVRWPDGGVQRLTGLPADRYWTLYRPTAP